MTTAEHVGPVHSFKPWGANAELFARRDQEVLLSGPAGTGKSRACLEKVHAMMLANPGARALMVRKTAVSLADAALQTFRRFVIPEALDAGIVEWYGGSRQEPAQYRYANGSAVMIGGMDNPTKVMSTEYDVIYVQEAIELSIDDWEALLTRLRNGVVSFQQLIADTNPDTPFHWLYVRVQAGHTVMLDTRHEDNPILHDGDGWTERGANYIANLEKLTGARKQRLRHGLWVAAEGIIYTEFDPTKHVVDRFAIPADWPRWWVIDWGFRNPFVCQFWARDGDGNAYMYREIYFSERIVEDHCRQILKQVTTGWHCPPGIAPNAYGLPTEEQWTEPMPLAIITDHDAEATETIIRHLAQGTLPAIKNVAEGIEVTKEWLKDGRLRFFRDALVERDLKLQDKGRPTETVQEFGSYVWARPPKTIQDRPPKDEPEKENDHGMDCLRYLCMELNMGAVTTRSL